MCRGKERRGHQCALKGMMAEEGPGLQPGGPYIFASPCEVYIKALGAIELLTREEQVGLVSILRPLRVAEVQRTEFADAWKP